MTKFKDEGKLYLSMYPKAAERWINECPICHMQGYKPDLPEKVLDESDQSIMKWNLMSYFKPLPVNDMGICQQCAKHLRMK